MCGHCYLIPSKRLCAPDMQQNTSSANQAAVRKGECWALDTLRQQVRPFPSRKYCPPNTALVVPQLHLKPMPKIRPEADEGDPKAQESHLSSWMDDLWFVVLPVGMVALILLAFWYLTFR